MSLFLERTPSISTRNLVDELRRERGMIVVVAPDTGSGEPIGTGRDRSDGENGITLQVCGGGYRVLRKRIGND